MITRQSGRRLEKKKTHPKVFLKIQYSKIISLAITTWFVYNFKATRTHKMQRFLKHHFYVLYLLLLHFNISPSFSLSPVHSQRHLALWHSIRSIITSHILWNTCFSMSLLVVPLSQNRPPHPPARHSPAPLVLIPRWDVCEP